ncbi:MAG: STAS domain-containing protein [Chitinispirillaceae bacterium]|nr:STAS domain-containing protein [Chitinispirillaceae bacterium]
MEITSGNKGDFRLFRLTGQFWRREDMEALDQNVSICITAQRPWVILDIERLSFISSQALGMFVRLHARCSEAGGKLILYQPRSSVRDVIELAELHQFIAFADTAEELNVQMSSKGSGGTRPSGDAPLHRRAKES